MQPTVPVELQGIQNHENNGEFPSVIRCSWYDRSLQPLNWCAEVVDIPLSMLATPIGWLGRQSIRSTQREGERGGKLPAYGSWSHGYKSGW